MRTERTTGIGGSTRPASGGAFDRLRPLDLVWLAAFVVLLTTLLVRNYLLGLTEVPAWRYGPVTVGSFGTLAVLNVLCGFYLVQRWCLRFGLDWNALAGGLVWILAIGYYVSHLVSVVLYRPESITDLRVLLVPWPGISSFGGILGGGVAAAIFLRRKGLSLWLYNDAILYGFIGGYIFGRMGCFAVHDHPGVPTDFVLGVDVLGEVRHDLGLYLMGVMIALFLAITWLARRGLPPAGSVIALVGITYSPVRFYLDSLRIADATYLGLTPGQWFCFPTFLIGLWALSVARGRRAG